MSGLMALLDDVAAIAKVASASVDDIASNAKTVVSTSLDDAAGAARIAASSVDDVLGQAVEASSKTAGAVIDDAAVSPKYVQGFKPDRELPIVWKIAKGSILNKLVFLMPAALLLSIFAPWLIQPILMMGGLYLVFEGAEKVWHTLSPSHHDVAEAVVKKAAGETMEDDKVKGAIRTDFVLSAEIMTIVLASLEEEMLLMEKASILGVSALLITFVVYGAVALIVRADDLGLAMARSGRHLISSMGTGIVKGMPHVLTLLMIVGTAAMIWVGGSILVHGAHELGWHMPSEIIEHAAAAAAHAVPAAHGAVEWTATAALDGVLGLAIGAVIVGIVSGLKRLRGGAAHG